MKFSTLLLITLFAIIQLALPVAAHSQEQEIDLIKRYAALNTGDTLSLRKILNEGISVNATNKNGNSLLMIAALNGDVVTMKFLIGAGADINLWNTKNLLMMYNSPLDYAVFGHQQEAVDLLLAAGADINKKDPTGMSAAMKCGLYKNYEMLRYLVSKGAILSKEDKVDMIVLSIRGITPIDKKAERIIKYLLQDMTVDRNEIMKNRLLTSENGSSYSLNNIDAIYNKILSIQQEVAKNKRKNRREIREQDSLRQLLQTGKADTTRYRYVEYFSVDLDTKETHTKIAVRPRVDSVENRVGHKDAGIVVFLLVLSFGAVYGCSKLMKKYVSRETWDGGSKLVVYVLGMAIIYPIFACIYTNLDDIMIREWGKPVEVTTLQCELVRIEHRSRYGDKYSTYEPVYRFLLFREDSVRIGVNQGKAKFDYEYRGDGERRVSLKVRYNPSLQKLSVDDNKYLQQNLNWILGMLLPIGLILLFCFGKFNKILYKLKKRLEKTSRSESGGFIEAPLLFTTYWTFSSKTYDSMEKFIRDVRYSELTKGLREEECMKPDKMILQKTSVAINFFNSDIRGDNDLSILITPSNGKNITEAELLFALHHKVIPHLGRLRSDTIQGIILFCESEDGKTAECLAFFGEP